MSRILFWAALSLSCQSDPASVSPLVTVEKLDVVQNCYATCPGSNDPAAALKLVDHCPAPAAACGFNGGSDKLRLLVDYGAVPVPASSTVAAPTITVILDGAEQPLASPVSTPPALGERRYFSAVLYAPEKQVQHLSFRAKGAEGFSLQVDGFSVMSPIFAVSVDGCADNNSCMRTAAVGVATFTVDVPAGFSETSATLSSLLNGVLVTETEPVKLTPKGTTTLEGRATLNVPASNMAGSGVSDFWDVTVSVGGFQQMVHFVLSPPDIELALNGCTSGCSSPLGEAATLTVTAPHDINATQAVITSDVDGMPSGQFLMQTWNAMDVNTRSAQLVLTAPAQGSHWTIHANVGEYPKILNVTLTVPTLTVAVAGCADVNACTLLAGVGSAVFTIDAPRQLGQSAALSSRLNGVPQPETKMVTLTPTGADMLEGVQTLMVPLPTSAQTNFWDVDVRVGTVLQTVQLTLTLPALALTIPACASDGGSGPCSLKQGTAIAIVVTAPHDINATMASLLSFVDGAPSGPALTQPWSIESVGTRSAVFDLNVPTGASWILQANVGPLSVQSQTISLTP